MIPLSSSLSWPLNNTVHRFWIAQVNLHGDFFFPNKYLYSFSVHGRESVDAEDWLYALIYAIFLRGLEQSRPLLISMGDPGTHFP